MHNLTSCLGEEVVCPLPPTEEPPEELAAAADSAPRAPLQAKTAIQMVLYEQNRISDMNICMRPRRIKIFLTLAEKAGTEQQIAFWSSICWALVVPTHERLRLRGHGD